MSKFKQPPSKSAITVDEVTQNGMTDFDIPERGIDMETVKHFGIRKLFNEVTQQVEGYFFPVTKNGDVTGYIQCSPHRPKKNGRFTVVGDVGVDNELLGQAQASEGAKVFIVEGFWDCMSAWQSLNNHKPSGYKGIPAVVSPALGIGDVEKSPNAKRQIANNIEFLDKYRDKVMCFDNDSGDYNVGQEAVKDIAVVLRNFKNVVLPVNDCNEMMLQKGEKELYFQLLQAKDYEHGSVVSGLSSSEEERASLLTPLAKGIPLSSLPNTSRLLQGLRDTELTVVLAPPKCGKTTLVRQINYDLIKAGIPTMGIYLEDPIQKVRQSMIAQHVGMHLPVFRKDPTRAPIEKVDEAMDLLSQDHVFFFDEREGRMTPQNVITQLEWAAIKGVKFIILDHLSFVFSGSDSGGNERKEIDKLITDLASFVKRTGVHVIAVAHITIDRNRNKPKNPDGSIKYPYWYEVEEYDARGSGAFAQLCWNMIAIDKQVTGDQSRGNTRTKVLYNREWDNTGIGDLLTVDKTSGKLISITEEY